MGRRFDFIAMGLLSFTALSACEPYRRTKECRWISDLVNPTLRAIDTERKTKDDAARSEHATMPVENFKTFMDNPVAGKAEPPKAQEIYKVLDNVMSGVLTNKDVAETFNMEYAPLRL